MKLAVYLTALLLTACGGGGSSAPPPADPEAYTISAYGDSTQHAHGQPHAASRPGAKIYNRGVRGSNSSQLLAGTDGVNFAWPTQMQREIARIVVINHGINDRDLTTYKANLRSMVEQAQAAGKVVVLEEPNPAGETVTETMTRNNFVIADFDLRRAAMRDLATHMGVYFCSQARVPLRDGIHPTEAGYATKANRLAACIADVL